MMKQGACAVCSWSLRPADAHELVKRLRALDIAAVQLALVPCVSELPWRFAIDFLRGEGIEVISGMLAMAGEDYTTLESIARTGGVRSDGHWGQNIDRALRVADLAERGAIELVTLHGGFLPHELGDPVRSVMIDRLRTIADIFAQRGIAIALETGQESAQTLALALREIDRPSVGVNFDPANMILYGMGDPVEAVEILAPWLRQVHIKDAVATQCPGTWGTEVPVGQGSVQWQPFLARVQRARTAERPLNLVIERESGKCRDADILAARDLVRRHLCTIV
ncbi:MAG: sugar phosphate isomerase/epimerase [Phycisphaerales bacterium]|nr:sugar phosphate isomerase/epimerase [Phycisphaerales bacterium]